MKFWVINWDWQKTNGVKKTYIVSLRARLPYTDDLAKAKKWKSLKAVERYIWLKTGGQGNGSWVIEEHDA